MVVGIDGWGGGRDSVRDDRAPGDTKLGHKIMAITGSFVGGP